MKHHWIKALLTAIYWLVIGALWLWAVGLYCFAVNLPFPLKCGVALLWLLAAFLLWPRTARLRWGRWLPPLFLLLPIVLWTSLKPGRIDEYRLEQSRMPWGEFQENRVIMHDLRACRYEGGEILNPGWYDLEVNVDSLVALDYLLVYFADWEGVAHTFLSFGFADGERIALSVEARRAAGEPYALLPGLYRQYELMYVMGDELDIVGLRLHQDGDPVYMLPIATPPEKIQGLFINMVKTANSLRVQPQVYNTITSTCTTQLAAQANKLRQEPINLWDWRLVFPGFSGELAQEAGLLALEEPLAVAMQRFLVNPDMVQGDDRHSFSASLHR